MIRTCACCLGRLVGLASPTHSCCSHLARLRLLLPVPGARGARRCSRGSGRGRGGAQRAGGRAAGGRGRRRGGARGGAGRAAGARGGRAARGARRRAGQPAAGGVFGCRVRISGEASYRVIGTYVMRWAACRRWALRVFRRSGPGFRDAQARRCRQRCRSQLGSPAAASQALGWLPWCGVKAAHCSIP